MPYVGNQPSGNFVQVTSQTITGNGGATYTLDRPAGNPAEIEVFVNHVRQDPASYSVTGTSLTLGGNITSSDSCYVVFQAAAVGTATHPATSNLQAADGTFSGDLAVGVASPETTVHIEGDVSGLNNGNVMHIEGNGAGGNRGINIGQIGDGSQARMFLQGYHSQSASNYWQLGLNPYGGSVLIGTDNDSLFNSEGTNAALTVAGSDTSTTTLGNGGAAINIVQTDGTAGNTAGLHFSREDTDGTPNYSGASIVAQFPDAQVTGQYPKGKLHFHTSTTANAAPSLKMTIDEAGRITTPNSLAVASYLNTSFTHTPNQSNKIINWSQSTGSGNTFPAAKHHSSFDYANSRFVAPVSGLYLMSFKPDYDRAITTGHFVSFGINGGTRTFDVLEDLPQNNNSGANYPAYLYLNQNDYVELHTHGSATYALRGGGGNQYHTWWFIIQLA